MMLIDVHKLFLVNIFNAFEIFYKTPFTNEYKCYLKHSMTVGIENNHDKKKK